MRSCVRNNEWSDADVFNTLRDVAAVDLGDGVNETALCAAAVGAGVLAPLPAKSIAAGDTAGLNRSVMALFWCFRVFCSILIAKLSVHECISVLIWQLHS
jgi:hypothetical protein